MKLLILNIYFHPDPTGTGLVITELARDLVAQGHEVTVITSVPHYGVSPGPSGPGRAETGPRGLLRSNHPRPGPISRSLSRFRRVPITHFVGTRRRAFATKNPIVPARLCRLWQRSWLDGIRVIRTAVYLPRRKTFGSRALNYASFTLLALLAGWTSGRQELIFCTSPPLSLGLSAWLLSRLKRAPLVFNVQDIYPDAAVLMGVLRRPFWIGLFRRMEQFVYRRASLITVISEAAKQNLRDKGVPAAKIAVIPNWVDVEHVHPLPLDNEFRRSLALPEEHLVMFAGNIGLIAGLEVVLEAAAELRKRQDIRFLLVGEGNAKEGLVLRARQMGLTHVTFLPTQPREQLAQVLGAADLHLVTLKRQMSITSVPSKSYGIMASGRPMVAAVDPGSEVWRLVEAAEAGVCVPPEDPEQLARAIAELCDHPDRRKMLGANGRAYVVRHHEKQHLTARYGLLLEAVAAAQRSETGSSLLAPGLTGRHAPATEEVQVE